MSERSKDMHRTSLEYYDGLSQERMIDNLRLDVFARASNGVSLAFCPYVAHLAPKEHFTAR